MTGNCVEAAICMHEVWGNCYVLCCLDFVTLYSLVRWIFWAPVNLWSEAVSILWHVVPARWISFYNTSCILELLIPLTNRITTWTILSTYTYQGIFWTLTTDLNLVSTTCIVHSPVVIIPLCHCLLMHFHYIIHMLERHVCIPKLCETRIHLLSHGERKIFVCGVNKY
jgi:hypothetical protein